MRQSMERSLEELFRRLVGPYPAPRGPGFRSQPLLMLMPCPSSKPSSCSAAVTGLSLDWASSALLLSYAGGPFAFLLLVPLTPPLRRQLLVLKFAVSSLGLARFSEQASLFSVALTPRAGINKEFNHTGERWFLWASDAKSAFLQGDQDASERDGPLYMRPPRDPLIEATGSFPAELYLVTGNCYGLPNAPRVWYLRVHKTMLERGFRRHTFDRCLYYYIGSDKKLQAVVIIHVDDFFCDLQRELPPALAGEHVRLGKHHQGYAGEVRRVPQKGDSPT